MPRASRVSRLPYFERWFIVGAVIGVAVGLADLALYYLNVYVFEHLIMGELLGLPVPHPGEPSITSYWAHLNRLLLLPILVALASLASWGMAILMRTPEVGSDEAIRAYHRGSRLGAGSAPAAIVSSSVTIGLGGSAGREGPASHAGASLGQLIADLFGASPEDRRRATAVGMGSAIGVIFKTPFAGSLMAAELLYRRDLEPDVIYPALIASAVGYAIYGSTTGFAPILGYYSAPFNMLSLPLYLGLGIVAGAVAMLYPYSLFGLRRRLVRAVANPALRALIGGALAGLVALAFPEVMGEGFGWLWQAANLGLAPSLLPLWAALALLPLAKILATSLTLGSGAKGGVLAPGLVIGGFTGLAVGELFHALTPSLVPSPLPFVVVGMLVTMGVAASAPLSVTLMVVEMTGGLQLLPAEMIALGAAYLVARGSVTVFREQVPSRAYSPAHAAELSVPLLNRIRVSDVDLQDVFIRPAARVSEALELMRARGLLSVPVVDELRRVLGIVSLTALSGARPDEPAMKYMSPEPGHVRPSSTLYEALELMGRSRMTYAIVEEQGGFIGILTMDGLLEAYRRALGASGKG